MSDAVLTAFEKHGPGDEGAHIDTVITALEGAHDENDVRDTIRFLESEGHVYSTVDKSHYKVTNYKVMGAFRPSPA